MKKTISLKAEQFITVDMSPPYLANWIVREFSGVHIRGLEKQSPDTGGAGQGTASQPATVRINTPLNRISEIHTRAVAPVDRALDSIADAD